MSFQTIYGTQKQRGFKSQHGQKSLGCTELIVCGDALNACTQRTSSFGAGLRPKRKPQDGSNES